MSSKSKTIKTPGPDHPITIERNRSRVVVKVADRVVADTRDALTLREAGYAPVFYIPRKDVDMALLQRTEQSTYCPYKGDCAYFSIPLGGERSTNAVWTYEAPYAAVASINSHWPSTPIASTPSKNDLETPCRPFQSCPLRAQALSRGRISPINPHAIVFTATSSTSMPAKTTDSRRMSRALGPFTAHNLFSSRRESCPRQSY